MNILVIDDEPIIRQGIIHKIRQSGLPVTIAGEAGDGTSGYELICKLKPDIVLTDIQMPSMSGLELIRKAQEHELRADFVILSGYDDFEYAKQAIQYGVSNYLLKPLENEELHATLSKLIDKREAAISQEKRVLELQSLEQANRETARQQALTQFLQQSHSDINDHSLRELQFNCSLFTAAVLQLEPFVLPHQSFHEKEEELLWFAVKNIVMERFASGGIQGVLVHHSLHRFELVYVLGIHEAAERSAVHTVLEEIMYGIRKYLRLELTIGLGSFSPSMTRIQDIYREAKQLTRNTILRGSNRIYQPNGAALHMPNRKSIIGNEDEKQLAEWFKRLESEKIHRWIERRVGAIVQDPNAVYVQLEWFSFDLFLLFHKYLIEQSGDSEWQIGEMDDLRQWLQQVTHWQEIVDRMKCLTDNIVVRLTTADPLASREIVEAVRLYINLHYSEPLSLHFIAERFYIHPNYFSKRFKEKCGESFIDYVTSVRMKEAVRLLKETEFKVHEIGERVGYEDAAYFGSVFRKFYGETPKQYRDRLIP